MKEYIKCDSLRAIMFFWKINKITSRSTSTNVNELNNSFA